MKNKLKNTLASALVLFVVVSLSRAQSNGGSVYWHIDPTVKTCSMIIDPSLTQAQWHTFTKQVGAISSFKSLSPARTLGKLNFRVGIDYASTPVDQHNAAWINTFAHPDEECPLGDAIVYPTLRASMGISDNVDVGGYWTVAPGANYGMLGGEIKYAFLQETGNYPAAAIRASATILTGVPDFNMNIYSVEVLASKNVAMFTPYVGMRANVAIGTETTSKVNLEKETVANAQGYAGVSYSVWMLNLAAEYNISSVNTFALAVGVNF